jgi:cbb3-type cytochrome oxidase maturation protein
MTALLFLIPVSLLLGLAGLAAFFWSVSNNQWDDPDGEAARILETDFDDQPQVKNSENKNEYKTGSKGRIC